MNVGVLGGGLQGIEAAYLLKKAGHRVIMIDRRSDAQAFGLADVTICLDVEKCSGQQLTSFLQKVDVVIPALENICALDIMSRAVGIAGKTFCFDAEAYKISSDKLLSNKLFADLNLPRPRPWPTAKLPLLVKPACASGSKDVHIITAQAELDALLAKEPPSALVMEEYLEGPSYSVEVVAARGKGLAFATTLLQFDEHYDCNRVIAPCGLSKKQTQQMEVMALKLAAALRLTGIMDMETIHCESEFKLLEIDARLPSQTPIVVYHASGVNLVSYLLSSFMEQTLPTPKLNNKKAVIYEHILLEDGNISFPGEAAISRTKSQFYQTNDFFGADEAITNYSGGKSWAATLILTGHTPEEVHRKQKAVHRLIKNSV